MRDRNYSLNRKVSTIAPLSRFVIFTEGANTEPLYIDALRRSLPKVLVTFKVMSAAGDPKTLAKKALDFKKNVPAKSGRGPSSSYEKNDQIWIVFDEDEHPKVKETIDNYRKAGIKVAYSNPCFELWLILHFEDYDKAQDRHQIQKHFETICKSYNTDSKSPDCDAFIDKVENAEKRAQSMVLRRQNEGAQLGPPFTDFHLLTSAIRSVATKAR